MGKRRRVLVSWIGHADLFGLAAAQPNHESAVRRATGKSIPQSNPPTGPVRAAMEMLAFDEVHVLADLEEDVLNACAAWLGGQVIPHRAAVHDPTDYALVFGVAESLLESVSTAESDEHPELWISLSSGTPAMAATLVLLGKTRFPARFIQSFQGRAKEAEIPFDLTLQYIPDLLREPDATLQLLADKNPADVEGFSAIVGTSQAIRLAVGRARRAAIRDVSVLILGESGVGKELFAQAIHSASSRRNKPFVAINCAAVPSELQESELFGHVQGAFTGATRDRAGAFQQADGGTLFLDEFGELELRAQAALLRALQPGPNDPLCRRSIRRVGADAVEHVDVRVIAATNREPLSQVREGALRQDLYYRVSTISLRLPALRERRSDIPMLVETLLARINAQFGRGEPGYVHKSLSAAAKGLVAQHEWPGNVRQLNNVLVQSAVMSAGPVVAKADIAAALMEHPGGSSRADPDCQPLGDGFDLTKYLDDIERRFLERACEESRGVKRKAADLLGLKTYQTLDAKLKRLGVNWKRTGGGGSAG